MYLSEINFFDNNLKLIKKPKNKEDLEIATNMEKFFLNTKNNLSSFHIEICELKLNELASNIIESLLFVNNITIKEISEILQINEDIIDEYSYWFCNTFQLDSYFKKKLFIENKISQLKNNGTPKQIIPYLFKRWALLLGKDFVVWKFDLQPLEINSNILFETILKEAFFKYKEITLGEKDIDYQDYVKSINSLVKTIKEINATVSQNSVSDDILYDIEKSLNISIEEIQPKLENKKTNLDLVNNALIQ